MTGRSCCVAGCQRPASEEALHPDEALCAHHLGTGSLNLVERMRTAAHRRERLDRIWANEGRYDAVVASGRYLKLCDATQAALEQSDAAWLRLKLDVILREGLRSDARAGARDAAGLRASG